MKNLYAQTANRVREYRFFLFLLSGLFGNLAVWTGLLLPPVVRAQGANPAQQQ